MEGVIKIWNEEGETHEVSLTNKDIKLLKNIMIDIEKEHIRSPKRGLSCRESQGEDPRLVLLYSILSNQIVWYQPWRDKEEKKE